MDRILLLLCSLLSCFIVGTILFQFMDESYEKTYKNRYSYTMAKAAMIGILTFVNMLEIPLLNLAVYLLLVAVTAHFFYYENNSGTIRKVVECEAVALCMSVCESMGVILLQWIFQIFTICIDDTIKLYCLEVTFSKVILIFLYYMCINRLVRKRIYPLSKQQYSIYVIILVYSFINMLLIVEEFTQRKMEYLWAVNMGCIVLADLYLLYLVKMSNDKSYFENQVKGLQQQANIQYEYYMQQTKKYNSTVRILHDVNKHIKLMETLYASNQGAVAVEYAKQINDLLKPLIPTNYTGNPILDILLTDKAAYMKEQGIDFQIQIDNVDLKGIEPIDVTTIFGNLLDNAIEAAEQFGGTKYIYIKIGGYHKMLAVRMENSSGSVRWKNGMPVSEKGKGRGLGLLNVQRSILKYDGDITLRKEDNKFIVEMFLNA